VTNSPESRLLRRTGPDGQVRVSFMELFFDLVYVFAITQLSHHLLEHLDWSGALEVLILFLAVWWAWMYTTWATNWIDPDCAANRLMLGCVMAASLVMSSTIPQAFGKGGLLFALAYVAVQIGRSLYVARAMGGWRRNGRNMIRASVWFCAAAIPWLAGGLEPERKARMLWWAAALAIEYMGPIAYFRVPGLGRSRLEEWAIAGGHMAERCGLFIIIALGEGLLITGATFAGLQPGAGTVFAFVTAFAGSFAMWWVYFDVGAKRGAEHIEQHDNPGLVGRNAFTYWHIPIVAGIILMAVTDELTLAHPAAFVHTDFLTVTTGGMALFLWGTMNFKKISSGDPWYPLSHAVGLGLVAVLAVFSWLAHPSTLAFTVASTAIFATVALWEWGSFHGGWIERMEARGWRLGRLLRGHSDRVVTRRRERRL
jgi:low temperature requirement protein LtrA